MDFLFTFLFFPDSFIQRSAFVLIHSTFRLPSVFKIIADSTTTPIYRDSVMHFFQSSTVPMPSSMIPQYHSSIMKCPNRLPPFQTNPRGGGGSVGLLSPTFFKGPAGLPGMPLLSLWVSYPMWKCRIVQPRPITPLFPCRRLRSLAAGVWAPRPKGTHTPLSLTPPDALEGGWGASPPPPPPSQSAQPMPSHCPPNGKCPPQWHL